MSKLNSESNRLWQKPRQGTVFYIDQEWYEGRHVMYLMKELIKEAKLSSNKHTNHSIRATCIGTLDRKGFEARHISTLSSHKNEATICTYSTKCPENKTREMYDALNESIIPKKKVKPDETASKNPHLQTINFDDIPNMCVAIDFNENSNNSNNNKEEKIPQNFELVPFDTDDDDILEQYLKDNLIINDVSTTMSVSKTNTTTMSTSNMMPVVPKMYFPHSNVTINYNFSK